MKNKVNSSNARFEYIDGLRGFAILGVIVAHSASITQTQGFIRTIADTAGMGVQLFFVISAFTIFHMLSRHAAQEFKPIRNFFIRRLFRIVPVYWFGIYLYTAIFGLKSRGWLPGPELWHYPWHITLTNLLHPLTQSSVVPGGWSISCEVLFYLSVPLWFKWIKNLSRAYVFTLICVFVLPIITKVISKIVNPSWVNVDPLLITLYWERFPLMSLGSFSFGILFFYLLKEENLVNFFRSKVINVWTVSIICLMLVSLSTVYPRVPVQIHIYCFLFMSLALMLSAQAWEFFVNRVTVFIGRISYSAYLFHFLVLKGISELVIQSSPNIVDNQYVYFLIVLVSGIGLTFPLAWCGYRFIESPAISASKRLIQLFEDKEKELRGGAV